MDHKPTPIRKLKLLLAFLLVMASAGCTVRLHLGSSIREFQFGPTPTTQPTYTLQPTYTPWPSFTPNPTYTLRPTYTLLPMYSPTPTEPYVYSIQDIPTPGTGEISQFVEWATASSEYTSTDFSASQATGVPDTKTCGDHSTAWASTGAHGKDWLRLNYGQAVIPTRIIVYQSYHPGAVSMVEVMDAVNAWSTVYTAAPQNVSQCPTRLEISVTGVTSPVSSVRVTLDQTYTSGWTEIDAVQLIGTP